MPSFSLGQYYDYENNAYTPDQTSSNEFDHCDCLKVNPLLVTNDTCKMSLDQEVFNENSETLTKKTLKRSILLQTHDNTNEWNQHFPNLVIGPFIHVLFRIISEMILKLSEKF